MDEIDAEVRADLWERGQYQAPNSSPEHLALRESARKSGQNEETLRDLLWLINAHDRLLGLPRIAENLLQILDLVDDGEPVEGDPRGDLMIFSGWRELLGWIVKLNQKPKPAQRSPSQTVEENPIVGEGVGRHPLYGCLWCRPKSKSAKSIQRYALLQRHVLIAHARYLFTESQIDSALTRSAYESYGQEEMWGCAPKPQIFPA